MGRTFGFASKEAVIAEVTEGWDDWRVIDQSVGLHKAWILWGNDAGDRIIEVVLIQRECGDWGYKRITETMHPFYYDCPKRILDASNCAAGQKWRDACRERVTQKAEARRKARLLSATLKPDDRVIWTATGETVRILYPAGVRTKRGSIAATKSDGRVFAYRLTELELAA